MKYKHFIEIHMKDIRNHKERTDIIRWLTDMTTHNYNAKDTVCGRFYMFYVNIGCDVKRKKK